MSLLPNIAVVIALIVGAANIIVIEGLGVVGLSVLCFYSTGISQWP